MSVTNEAQNLIPSDEMVQRYSGSERAAQYVTLGDNLLTFLVQYAGLQSSHRVLDVGCGIGLAARPLAKFLTEPGSYDGFDIMSEPIDWCRQNYRDYPNFRFVHADIYNKHYNPGGKVAPERFRFPYSDNQFDVVVLTAVFSHLLPDAMVSYLAEVVRVLKHEGRCFISYFLLNAESSARIDQWMKEHPDEADRGVPGGLGFRWEYDERCRVFDPAVPEKAVAYSERWIMTLHEAVGLEISQVRYGEWCRRSLQPGWQDAILAVKRSGDSIREPATECNQQRAEWNRARRAATDARSRYLDLLKLTLTDSLYDPVDGATRREGLDWPSRGCTMIGLKRLDNLQECIEDVLAKGVPGDFIETGVWRGGATIFMRALLKIDGVSDRVVWVADSFKGLPPPDIERYPADAGDTHHRMRTLAVPLDEVRRNFEKFDVLDDGVRFLEGWFRDTLGTPEIRQLAILRLDGDMYGSTMEALEHLYWRLSVGGYVIVDDYGAVPGCRKAVEDFRERNRVNDPMLRIDWTGVFWRRTKEGGGIQG